MANDYTDALAAWADQKAEKKRRQDTTAVAFLAVKSDVIEAMEAGYALTTIYEHMHETGRVRSSYETFRRHVHRFIKSATPAPTTPTPKAATKSPSSSPATTPAVTAKPATPAAPASSEPGEIRSFIYNPKPNPDDLF